MCQKRDYFGLSETSSQDVTATMSELLSELGEKPKTDVTRIGEKRDGVVRPVKVGLRTRAVATQLLTKASALRKTERFNNVYVCPERSVKQRTVHRKLVADLRKKAHHFVRDGAIMSRDKDREGGV